MKEDLLMISELMWIWVFIVLFFLLYIHLELSIIKRINKNNPSYSGYSFQIQTCSLLPVIVSILKELSLVISHPYFPFLASNHAALHLPRLLPQICSG